MKKIIISLLCIMVLLTIPFKAKATEPLPDTATILYITTKNFNEGYTYYDGSITLEYIEIQNRADRAYIRTIPIRRTLEFDNKAEKNKVNYFTLEDNDSTLKTGTFDPSKDYYLNILLNNEENINNFIDCIYVNGMSQNESTIDPTPVDDIYHNVRFKLPKTSYFYKSTDGPSRKYYFEEPIETGYNGNKVFIGFSSDNDASKIYTNYPTTNGWDAYPIWDDLKIIEQPSASNNYTVKTNESKNWLHYYDISYQWEMYKESQEIVLDGDPYPGFGPGDPIHSGDGYTLTYVSGMTPAITDAETNGPKATLGASGTLVIQGANLIGKTLSLKLSSAPSNLFNKNGTKKNFTYNNTTNRYEFNIEEENVINDEFKFDFDVSTSGVTIEVYIIDPTPGWYSIVTSNPNELDTREYGKYRCKVDLASTDAYVYSNEIIFAPQQTSSKPKRYITRATSTKEVIDPVNGIKKEEAAITGSGKKGSTVTISLPENRRVLEVVATDKKGNEIELTKIDEKTLTFVQPASNVNVEIKYINKEIKLNIGSKEASVDDNKSTLDVAPKIKNDRTMLPIRFIAESLDAIVNWDEKNPNLVTIEKGNKKVEITIGSNKAKINDNEVELDVSAFAENDRTYLPVRFVSEALDAVVRWNESKPSEVLIYDVE